MDKILKIKSDLYDLRSQLDMLDKQKEQYIQLYNSKVAELDIETKRMKEGSNAETSIAESNDKADISDKK